MELQQLLTGNESQLKVEWGEHVVLVTYDPAVFTPKLETEITRAGDLDDAEAFVEILARVLKEWDVTNHGEPWPLTPENLSVLPLGFLGSILQAIGKEMGPNPLSGGTSEGP